MHPTLSLLLLLLRSNPSRQHSKVLGGKEKWKDRKTQKSRSEEKVVDFCSASTFPTKKWEAVTQGGDMEKIPGSKYCQRLRGQVR